MKKVRVYEDPINRDKLEGIAEVVQVLQRSADGYSPEYRYIKCRFPGDAEPVVYRVVHKSDIFEEA